MRYKTFLSMTPPTATAQHHGERVIRVGGRNIIKHYIKKSLRVVYDKYIKMLQHEKLHFNINAGCVFTFTKPIRVEIDFLFPHPTTIRKRDKDKCLPKVTRPDVDNMAKGLLDCITKVGFIKDDSIIFDLRLRKLSVPKGKQGVRILITDELEDYNNDETKQEKETTNE